MKRKIIPWTAYDFYLKRDQVQFPVFQRERVWPEEKMSRLIDSIEIYINNKILP